MLPAATNLQREGWALPFVLCCWSLPGGCPGGCPGAGTVPAMTWGWCCSPITPGPFRRAHKGALSWELEPSESSAGFQGTPQALRKGPPKAAAGFKGFLKGDKRTPLWRFPAPMENCSGGGKNRFCFTIMWSSAQGQQMQHQRRKNKYIMNEYAVIFREKLTAFAWKSENTLHFLVYLEGQNFGFCAVNSLSPRRNAKQILEISSRAFNKQYIDKTVIWILHLRCRTCQQQGKGRVRKNCLEVGGEELWASAQGKMGFGRNGGKSGLCGKAVAVQDPSPGWGTSSDIFKWH